MQIYLRKDNNPVSLMEGTLLAVGGRYDYLLQQMADSEYVGVSKVSISLFASYFLGLTIIA